MNEKEHGRENTSARRKGLRRLLGKASTGSERGRDMISTQMVELSMGDGTVTYEKTTENWKGSKGMVTLDHLMPHELGEFVIVQDKISDELTRRVRVTLAPFMTPDGELRSTYACEVFEEHSEGGVVDTALLGEQSPNEAFSMLGESGFVHLTNPVIQRFKPVATNP